MTGADRAPEELLAVANTFREGMVSADLPDPDSGSILGLWLDTAAALEAALAAREPLTRYGYQAARSFNPSVTWCEDQAEAGRAADRRRAAGMPTVVVWERYVTIDGKIYSGPRFVA